MGGPQLAAIVAPAPPPAANRPERALDCRNPKPETRAPAGWQLVSSYAREALPPRSYSRVRDSCGCRACLLLEFDVRSSAPLFLLALCERRELLDRELQSAIPQWSSSSKVQTMGLDWM